MEFDSTRLPTGRSSWTALIDYALSLGDLAELDYLEAKGTLPFDRLSSKASGATIARAILGMANRMPEVAAQHLEGRGVVLVGISGGEVVGAEEVDPADLEPHVVAYVGEDGPDWSVQYVRHPKGLVMVVVVGPPRWGDPIRTWRREATLNAKQILDGTIFVRTARTHPATSTEVANLSRRLTVSPHAVVEPQVEFLGQFDRASIDSMKSYVQQVVDRLVEEQLEDVPSGGRSPADMAGLPRNLTRVSPYLEKRTPAEFRQEVTNWREEARERVDAAAIDLMRHVLLEAELMVSNPSVMFLPGVVVRLEIPEGFEVLLESDRERTNDDGSCDLLGHLPKRPRSWGSVTSPYAGLVSPGDLHLPWVDGSIHMSVNGAGRGVLVWDVGELRPEGVERATERVILWTGLDVQQVTLPWTMTARGVDHVYRGRVAIECGVQPGVVRVMQVVRPDGE